MKRRFFLGGLAATIAAPALVARSSIMAIKIIDEVPPLASPSVVEFIELGEIDRFRIYVDHALPDSDRTVLWLPPQHTASEIVLKRREAYRSMRQWLEPLRSRRWV